MGKLNTRRLFEEFYWAVQRRVVPELRDSQYEYKDIVQSCAANSRSWLDLGCGHHMFGQWMSAEQKQALSRAERIVGLDYELASLKKHQGIRDRVVGDVYDLPLKSGSFDLITSNMVMEHLQDPAAALLEIGRLLKGGGVLVFHTPNILHYQFRIAAAMPQWTKRILVRFLEGRGESDIFPTHYQVNSLDAIATLAAENGYCVREIKMVNSSAETIMLGPLVIFELLVIKFLNRDSLRKYRSNIVAVLEKEAMPASDSDSLQQLSDSQAILPVSR